MKICETTEKALIEEIVCIHMQAFEGFFLTELGKGFLKTLYKGYMDDEKSGILVAKEKGKLLGFVAYSKDYSAFFKGLIKRKIIQFGFYSMLAFIKHPSFLKRLIGAFGKSDEVAREEKYVELSSIAVKKEIESKGVGSKMINKLKEITDFTEYKYISLETDAENNDKVNGFYKKNGFELTREYGTKYGRKMNEYRYAKNMVTQ
ncbi:MAG: GNAT family N-acetyltransferase [Lachnospiraceae bacterium]|nr:GNAT family N-acetyltransferase [Lachnospiraceae bacterium]